MLAHGLQQRGHSVLVVEIGDCCSEACDRGVPIFMLPRSRLPWLGNLITRVRLRNWLAARVGAREIELIEVPDYPGFLPFRHPRVRHRGALAPKFDGFRPARGTKEVARDLLL